MEKRNVATVNIPGAFMQLDIDDDQETFMKLEGRTVDILKHIDPPQYSKHITTEKGKQVIYVKLKKAIYGALQASLLFWKNLTKTLKEWGVEISPYDWCVANKLSIVKKSTLYGMLKTS